MILKAWMGHAIGSDVESHYVLPPEKEQMQLYQDSYRYIDLEVSDLSKRVEELEAFKKSLTPEQRATMEKLQLREKARKTPKSQSDCEDGAHCQRVIAESELETALSSGWRFIASLSNGKCVVSND
jgi:hypothetical protein